MALAKHAEELQELIWEHEDTVRREFPRATSNDDANNR